jgi:hypothetical protein
MIEINLDTLAVDADAPPTEMLENGAPANVHLQVVGGNDLPFADPRGGNRPLRYPSLAVNFQLSKAAALEFAELVRKKAESLPDDKPQSNVPIATSMDDVAKAAEFERNLKRVK